MAWGLANISSLELSEWQAYFTLEPPETSRQDVRAALQMALTANIHRAPEQSPYNPEDFLPRWGSDPDSSLDDDWEYLTDEQQESLIRAQALEDKVRAINAAFGGKDLTDEHTSHPDG